MIAIDAIANIGDYNIYYINETKPFQEKNKKIFWEKISPSKKLVHKKVETPRKNISDQK